MVVTISSGHNTGIDFQAIYAQSLPSTGESLWATGESMPTPRTEIAVTILEDKIYVIGGFDKLGNVLDTVEVYDITANKWQTLKPIPQPVHHAAAASLNGSIYVIGGYTNNVWLPTSKFYIYDPKNDTWDEGSSMPTARGALTAIFIDGILYAIGGQSGDRILDINEAYDQNTASWTSKSSMPTARHHTASAVVDGNAYLIGGRIKGISPITNVNVTEMYDPNMDKWSVLQSMPSKRSGLTATAYDGNIYVFGGEDLVITFQNNEKYNTTTDKWTIEKPLPTPRHGLGSAFYDNKIYVIGGGPKPGLSASGAVEIFNVR